jgi:protein gp37
MSDLFGKGIPERWTSDVLDSIRRRPDWRFYLLTKQGMNLVKFSPFPDNCYVGISAWDGLSFVESCEELSNIQAKVKFISLEPFFDWDMASEDTEYWTDYINWLIIGSQTKPTKHPDRLWVDTILDACEATATNVFVKEPMASHYNIHRQEFPLKGESHD